MSIYRRIPRPPLEQHVEWLWYYADFQPDHDREHVLPDGTFDLIINLEDRPRKLFDRGHADQFHSFKRGWLSGAQAEFLIIDALPDSTMIGAHFKPGGAARFLGLPASELCRQVVELDALWGAGIWEWRERLLAAPSPLAKFEVFEQMLRQRLSATSAKARGNRGVTWAISEFVREPHLQSIAAVSHELGVSHKQFIEQFRREVGLTPKLFCRVRRFQEVLALIRSQKSVNWADVACSCGYFDQAHFVNDFVAFAGLNPTAYLDRRLEEDSNFVRASV
ncbi:MAG TPA: helix-turn-helix domain-containing protein [Verrucomicrobiae bacterium]|jgi:AraC-like DNA-binding protein|nr:helix-turn-helix domain-containing protein [Verrucomicrobiae bacterium]